MRYQTRGSGPPGVPGPLEPNLSHVEGEKDHEEDLRLAPCRPCPLQGDDLDVHSRITRVADWKAAESQLMVIAGVDVERDIVPPI